VKLSLVNVWLLIIAWFVPPVEGGQLAEVQEVLMQCQSAHYRLTDYRGVVRHELVEDGNSVRIDDIEVTFRKPSFLRLRWQEGVFKGTTLLWRPAWNQGSILIRLGDWFDFLTLNLPLVDVAEPFAPGLRDLNEWLTALSMLAQRALAADHSLRQVKVRSNDPAFADGFVVLIVPAFLVPFRDNRVSTYEFMIERGTGIPVELVLRGAGGEVQQRSVVRDLQVNVGTSIQAFDWEEQSPGSGRSLSSEEAEIDVRRFVQNWQRRSIEIADYTGTWILEERRNGSIHKRSSTFKFRKPFDVYVAWETDGQGGRREELFRQGWNNDRVRVRTTAGGLPLIGDIEPQSYFVQWGYRHAFTELGVQQLVERLQTYLLREWLGGRLRVAFRGVEECEEQLCYKIEFNFSRAVENEHLPSRIVTYWDIAARLPVQYDAFDWADQLLERVTYRQLRLNVALRDSDFDAANPSYGFLLFPQAPRLDRFFTGRE
jgi:hypothetical protein